MSKEYWRISLECGLDEIGAFDVLTDEQIDKLAESLAGSMEHYGLGTGRDAIPNPLATQMEEAKRNHAEEVKRLEADVRKLEHHIAPLDMDDRRRYSLLREARR